MLRADSLEVLALGRPTTPVKQALGSTKRETLRKQAYWVEQPYLERFALTHKPVNASPNDRVGLREFNPLGK